jgi:hypothetical protein
MGVYREHKRPNWDPLGENYPTGGERPVVIGEKKGANPWVWLPVLHGYSQSGPGEQVDPKNLSNRESYPVFRIPGGGVREKGKEAGFDAMRCYKYAEAGSIELRAVVGLEKG